MQKTKTRLNQHKRGSISGKRKFNPKLEEYELKSSISIKKSQMFYTEVRNKGGFFRNFVDNNINKKKKYIYIC